MLGTRFRLRRHYPYEQIADPLGSHVEARHQFAHSTDICDSAQANGRRLAKLTHGVDTAKTLGFPRNHLKDRGQP